MLKNPDSVASLLSEVPNGPLTLKTRRTLQLIQSSGILINEVSEILSLDDDEVSGLNAAEIREKLAEALRIEKGLRQIDKELFKLVSFWESAPLSKSIPNFEGYQVCYDLMIKADPTATHSSLRASLDVICNIRSILRSEIENKAQEITPSLSKLMQPDSIPSDALSSHSVSSDSDHLTDNPAPIRTDIAPFGGDTERWPTFWAEFKRFVHDTRSPRTTKFAILRKLLTGEASQRVCLLPPEGKYYDKAIEMLLHFYGSENRTAAKLLDNLLTFRPNLRSPKEWHDSYAYYYQNLTSVRAMGHSDDAIFARLLLNHLSSCPPLHARILADSKSELPSTDEILHSWYHMEPTPLANAPRPSSSNIIHNLHSSKPPRVLSTDNSTGRRSCQLCKESHSTYHCTTFSNPSSRKEQALSIGLCLNCLSARHKTLECKSERNCTHCSKRHHSSICLLYVEGAKVDSHGLIAVRSERITPRRQILMCGKALISHPDDPSRTTSRYVFFDSGSSCSYVSPEVAAWLSLTPAEPWESTVGTFGNAQPFLVSSHVTDLRIHTLSGEHIPIRAVIFQPCVQPLSCILVSPLHEEAIEKVPSATSIVPDILIGADYFLWFFLNASTTMIQPGLFISHTLIGPILSGQTTQPQTGISSGFVASSLDPPDLSRFWEMEQLGITDTHDSLDAQASDFVRSTINWVSSEKRFAVKWPWVGNRPPANSGPNGLPSNLSLCVKRLSVLLNHLRRNPRSLAAYDDLLQEQLQSGIIERAFPRSAPDQLVHYLPHHAVFKESNGVVKIRQVYDASSHVKSSLSLNDHLLRGPVMLPVMSSILLRLRTYNHFLVADIEKAFHQVLLQEEDRDVCRFLWVRNTLLPPTPENLIHLRFRVVPFGIKPSPFLLAITISAYLENHVSPLPSPILRDLYVDNILLPTSDSVTEVLQAQQDLRELFGEIGMNVREFASNVPEFHKSHNPALPSSLKLLGMTWEPSTDNFLFCLSLPPTKISTKRHLASISAKLTDPLGLVSPLLVPFKLLLQSCWKEKHSWDAELPLRLIESVPEILKSLSTPVLVPRYCGTSVHNLKAIHACSDASSLAYGTCIYLQSDGFTSLIFAKNKVAPLSKTLTIPQLELLGVVASIRAIEFVCTSLGLPIDIPIHVWCDNQPVLHWISNDTSDSIFVRNRIRLIRSFDRNLTFHFIPTAHNPADMLSRGVLSHEFDHTTWFTAPYLAANISSDVFPLHSPSHEVTLSAIRIEEIPRTVFSPCIPLSSFVDFSHMLLLITRLLSVLSKWSNGRIPYHLQKNLQPNRNPIPKVVLHRHALSVAFRWAQKEVPPTDKEKQDLHIFEDDWGVLRCRTRLENSPLPYDTIHPVFLSPASRITEMYILYTHQRGKHCTLMTLIRMLRDTVWIPRIRITVKRVVYHCPGCHRESARRFSYPPFPQLPISRTTPSPPFTHVGVDYLGPFQLESKVWVCLFTCLSTRAIQCELADNLSGARFLHILRRFISRRGVPLSILSDNGLCFQFSKRILTDSYVSQFLSFHSIEWSFITEFAPWQGGVYERMVGLFKKSLYATIGRKLDHHLDIDSFVTFLHEAEAVVNSRPLGRYLIDKEHIPIRPCDLLVPGRPLLTCPTLFPDSLQLSKEDSLVVARYNFIQDLSNYFWKHWCSDYLLSLNEQPQDRLKIPGRQLPSPSSPSVGDQVILEDRRLPRNLWRTGHIVSLKNGARSRSAMVEVAIPIRAVGQVNVHIRAPDLSRPPPLPACNSCSVVCSDLSASFETPYASKATIKACFLTRAHSWSCHSTNASFGSIPFPVESQSPAVASVFIFHQGQLTWSDHITCPLDTCHRPSCIFCDTFKFYLLNCFTPFWSSVSLFVIILSLLLLLPMFCCVFSMIKWALCCSAFFLKSTSTFIRCLLRKQTGTLPTSNSVRSRTFRRLRNRLRASLLLALPFMSMACDTVHSISASHSVVQIAPDGSSITSSRFSSLVSTRAHNSTACFFLGNDKSNIGVLSVRLFKPVMRCVKTHWYYTMDHVFRTPSVIRCFNSGSCQEGVCADLKGNATIRELEGTHPNKGYTTCLPSCGCLTCGCFHCDPACLFIKMYPVATNNNLYEVFSCPQWSVHIPFEGRLVNQTVSSSFNGILESGHAFTWNNISLTVASQSFPPVYIPEVFLRNIDNGQTILVTSAAPRGSPIPSLPGQLQCSSRLIDSCHYLPSTCHCSNDHEDGALCRCADVPLAPLFENPENLIPRSHGHLLLREDKTDNSIFAEVENAASVQLLFESSVSILTPQESLASCSATATSLEGCHSCLEGASSSISCSSSVEITAHLECPTSTYEIHCGPEPANSSLTVHVTTPNPHYDCVLICPASQSSITFSGTLEAKSLPFLASLILSRSTATGLSPSLEFHLPDFTQLIDSVISWASLRILAPLIIMLMVVLLWKFSMTWILIRSTDSQIKEKPHTL